MADSLQSLVHAATEAASRAYAPYSGFHVGAALMLSNGETVTGANVENVSFGLTICAERSAMVRAIALYGPAIRVKAVAVTNLNDAPSPPCGACRQFLAEFTSPETPVTFPSSEGPATRPFGELLPFSFSLETAKK